MKFIMSFSTELKFGPAGALREGARLEEDRRKEPRGIRKCGHGGGEALEAPSISLEYIFDGETRQVLSILMGTLRQPSDGRRIGAKRGRQQVSNREMRRFCSPECRRTIGGKKGRLSGRNGDISESN